MIERELRTSRTRIILDLDSSKKPTIARIGGRGGPPYSDVMNAALRRVGHCADQEDFKPSCLIREEII